MKLKDLIWRQLSEGISEDKAVNIFWRKKRNNYTGFFSVNNIYFVIEITYESKEDLAKEYKIEITNKFITDPIVYRVDFYQVTKDGYTTVNTNNMGILGAVVVLSTVAFGTAKFFIQHNMKFNVVYFAAKSFSEQQRNQRQTLYPRIGRLVASLIHSKYEKIEYSGGTIIALTQGLPFDEEIHKAIKQA